jgi:hypothetical protein
MNKQVIACLLIQNLFINVILNKFIIEKNFPLTIKPRIYIFNIFIILPFRVFYLQKDVRNYRVN